MIEVLCTVYMHIYTNDYANYLLRFFDSNNKIFLYICITKKEVTYEDDNDHNLKYYIYINSNLDCSFFSISKRCVVDIGLNIILIDVH